MISLDFDNTALQIMEMMGNLAESFYYASRMVVFTSIPPRHNFQKDLHIYNYIHIHMSACVLCP